jgi:hypothetical protein
LRLSQSFLILDEWRSSALTIKIRLPWKRGKATK